MNPDDSAKFVFRSPLLITHARENTEMPGAWVDNGWCNFTVKGP